MFSRYAATRAAFHLILLPSFALRTQTPTTSPPETTANCTPSQPQITTPASKAKQAMSWMQRQAAKIAAAKSGAAPPPATPPAPPCPASAPVDSGTASTTNPNASNPPADTAPATPPTSRTSAPTVPAVLLPGEKVIFGGSTGGVPFGEQSGQYLGSVGGGIDWDHFQSPTIPGVSVSVPGSRHSAVFAYKGHPKGNTNVHYLHSTETGISFKLVVSGSRFTVYSTPEIPEHLVGGPENGADTATTDVTGAQNTSPIEISNGDGTQALLTYTNSRGQKGTLNVHRAKPSSNPDGDWLNPDETVIFTVAGAAVTLSPAKPAGR